MYTIEQTSASAVLMGSQTAVPTANGYVHISDFSFGKSVLVGDALSQVLEQAGVKELAGALSGTSYAKLIGEAKGLFESVIESLPKLLREGQAPLFALIGLLITPNDVIAEWHAKGAWGQGALKAGADFAFANTVPVVLSVFKAGMSHFASDPNVEATVPNWLAVVATEAKKLLGSLTSA